MSTVAHPTITAQGLPLDTAPAAFGELRRSDDAITDIDELRRRLDADGYLYLPGYLDRDHVLAARHDLLTKIAAAGGLRPGTDPAAAIPSDEPPRGVLSELARGSEPLMSLLYAGRMTELYRRFFGEEIRHFDYTWLRAIRPGRATKPHMDSVFMNRGTHDLLTAWTPLGDVDQTLGGLAVLERSHVIDPIKQDYGMRDVDTYCSNHAEERELAEQGRWAWDGALSYDPVQLRQELGRRWLTADFRAGDLVTFTMFTVHIGLDNNSDRLRLSSDSRYQRASEPADPRWIGVDPTAHSARSKRGTIC